MVVVSTTIIIPSISTQAGCEDAREKQKPKITDKDDFFTMFRLFMIRMIFSLSMPSREADDHGTRMAS